MPSHLSSIGFRIESADEFEALAHQVADETEVIQTSKGSYLKYAPGGGEELWLQVNKRNELDGMNPHYSGASDVTVALASAVDRPTHTALDGAFYAWAGPGQDATDSGCYPFVFDCPDARACDDVRLPGRARAQIAAFAHELEVYDSLDAYEAGLEGEEPRLASQAFIPSGLFTPDGGKTEPPEAHAVFTGHILQAAERVNALTSDKYFWLLVDSYEATYDVVVDPDLLSAPPPVGGVVSGSFWLSGRLISYEARKPGLLRKLFRGR